jgi:SRSO17 transposase
MPFGYVAADEVYGRCPALRGAIERAGYGYVLEVGCDFRVSRHPGDTSRADALVGEVPRWGWEQRCQGPGAKGLRTHAWAWVALDPAGCPDGWARSLLIRRDPDTEPDGGAQYAYFLCYHPRGTTLTELIGVAGRRWGIEEAFAITKSEAGLDEHQVRRWTAWYRHATLSMLAAAFLAVARARLPANPTAWPAG